MTLTDITSKQTFFYWSHFSVCLETSCPVSIESESKEGEWIYQREKAWGKCALKEQEKKKMKSVTCCCSKSLFISKSRFECLAVPTVRCIVQISGTQLGTALKQLHTHTLSAMRPMNQQHENKKKLKICFGPLLLYRIARINSAIHWCIASVVTYCRSYLFYLVYCWMAVGWFYTDPYQTQIILCSASSRLSLSLPIPKIQTI